MTKSMVTATIEALGDRGDGQFTLEDKTINVPLALPGEKAKVFVDGRFGLLEDLIEENPERVEPQCRHYSLCGGCSLQHMSWESYYDFKRSRVDKALARQNISFPGYEIFKSEPRSRRRVTLTAKRGAKGFEVGFLRRRSKELERISDCVIATSSINGILPHLPPVLNTLKLPKETKLTITQTQTGIDVAISERAGVPSMHAADRIATLCRKAKLARLSANREVLFEDRPPELGVGTARVIPPPGGFLQASETAEQQLADFVLSGIRGKKLKTALDLYSGSGTFTLRLATRLSVHAVELERDALKALEYAAHRTKKLKPITLECRNLEKRPLEEKALSRFDVVVLDPPRAGAERQITHLARSNVETILYVSCDPTTFSRDARILLDGGYDMTDFITVDQFLWSHHIEVAARFIKPKTK